MKYALNQRLKMLEAEARGLQIIAETHTVRVPRVELTGVSGNKAFLIMEHLPLHPHTASSQEVLGRQLAALHGARGSDRFGLDFDNTIGLTPQINTWSHHWVSFLKDHRLGFQLKAIEKKYGDTKIKEAGERLLEKLDTFFEGIDVWPSLLHGDLWSGNTAALTDGTPVIYDPACYYGHHEADLSMMSLFGGFSSHFFDAYHERLPKQAGFEERSQLYQLYHVLNHYLLFGGSYRGSALSLLSTLSS